MKPDSTLSHKPALKPEWFSLVLGKRRSQADLAKRLQHHVPNSICEEARCPNRAACYQKGTMTFLILGKVCTRRCRFCSVQKSGELLRPQESEIEPILGAIEALNIRFVVLTSPTRDDLPDGGAGHFAYAVQRIRAQFPKIKVEVLVPDFRHNHTSIETVLASNPDVFNHNLETVPSLYSEIRAGADYQGSLALLAYAKKLRPDILTKSGVMMGLGESESELQAVLSDIKQAQVDILTVGQYLQPQKNAASVVKYYEIADFERIKTMAYACGIRFVYAHPMVRSSYMAEDVFDSINKGDGE